MRKNKRWILASLLTGFIAVSASTFTQNQAYDIQILVIFAAVSFGTWIGIWFNKQSGEE